MSAKLKIVVLILMVCAVSVPYAFEPIGPKDKKITLVFRYDDYSATSFTEFEENLITAFRRHGARCTFGVVPFVCAGDAHDPSPQKQIPLPPRKIDILKEAVRAGVVDVGLHGYSHQTTRPGRTGYTEFEGVPLDVQIQKIAHGKRYLEEIIGGEVATFIPPWNSYDVNTIKSLEQSGFRILSGDFDGAAHEHSTLKFFPAASALHKMRRAVRMVRWNSGRDEQLIVVLFHDYDFKEVNQAGGKFTLKELSDFISWAGTQEDLDIRSIRQVADGGGDFGAQKYMTYKAFHRIAPVMSLELLFPIGAYSSGRVFLFSVWQSVAYALLIYGAIFWLFFLVSYRLSFKYLDRLQTLRERASSGAFSWGLALMVVPAAFFALCFRLDYKYVFGFTVFFGALGGIFLSWASLGKKNRGRRVT